MLKDPATMLQSILQAKLLEVVGLKVPMDCTDFESFEHKFIGDRIELEQDDLQNLKLLNGIETATFGKIIALTFIDPSKGINQTDSFLAAYNSLTRIPKMELQGELNKEITTLKKGSQPARIGTRKRKSLITFNGGEHQQSAKKARLQKDKLTLPNGLEIEFGHIIALAGDHYGIPEKPVIDPSILETEEVDVGRHQRFTDAYNTLARTPKEKIQNELKKLLGALDKEMKAGKSVSNSEWDNITGGKWLGGFPFKQGRMMKLAVNNHDHFLPYAKHAYLTGHQLALDKAREASEKVGNEKKMLLHEALSLDAFACHFLTDSFASGHIRVPRVEMGKVTAFGKDGPLLCKYMHDEDGDFGLRVTNVRGDKWIAYGDGTLFEKKSKDNLKLVTEAVQKSVDQVLEACQYPTKPLNTDMVTDLIPFVDPEEKNNYPLFQVKDGQIHKRKDINNLQDSQTVTGWWGLSSALEAFLAHKPKNSAI